MFVKPQDEFQNLNFGILIIWEWTDLGANKDYQQWAHMLIQMNSLNYIAIPLFHFHQVAAGLSNAFDATIYPSRLLLNTKYNGYCLVLDHSAGTGLTDTQVKEAIQQQNIIFCYNVDQSGDDLYVEDITNNMFTNFQGGASYKAIDLYTYQIAKTSLKSQIRSSVSANLVSLTRYEETGTETEFGTSSEKTYLENHYMSFFSTLSILVPNRLNIDTTMSEALWATNANAKWSVIVIYPSAAPGTAQQSAEEVANPIADALPFGKNVQAAMQMKRRYTKYLYDLKDKVLYGNEMYRAPDLESMQKHMKSLYKVYDWQVWQGRADATKQDVKQQGVTGQVRSFLETAFPTKGRKRDPIWNTPPMRKLRKRRRYSPPIGR